MKSILSKINFVITILFVVGIFFASARTVTHINFSVEKHQHTEFYDSFIKLKQIDQKNRTVILDKKLCENIDNNKIHRHYLRWVFEKVRLSIFDLFKYDENSGKKLSYIYSMMLAVLVSLSFFVSILTLNRNIYYFVNNHKLNFIFLFLIFFFIIAIYAFRTGQETRFSFFELFFLSASLYFTYTKKKVFFLITVILATLNRESGILISSIWFLINGFNLENKKIELDKKNIAFGFFAIISAIVALVAFNYQIFSCGFNINLFIFESKSIFSTIGPEVKSSLFRNINVLFSNFLIIFFLLYYFWVNFEKQFKLLLIILFYNLVFVFFATLDNNILRIILAPLFVLYCNEYFNYQQINKK